MPFNGRAIYDEYIHTGVAEDVAEMVGMISPHETPLLSVLQPAERPAFNVLHEWLYETLNPNTVSTSTALGSTTAASSLELHDGSGGAAAQHLMVGSVLVTSADEYIVVTAVSGDSITFSRAQAGTAATSLAAGETLDFISDAALEGADVAEDISRPRRRKQNYTQIFKKDILVSGTVQAQRHLGRGRGDEWATQVERRLTESLRDLEKAVIRGRSFGNTLGTASVRRTFSGLLEQLTTNVSSIGTMTANLLNTAIEQSWDEGGDPDLIVCDKLYAKEIDLFNNSRVEVSNEENKYRDKVRIYEGSYGQQRIMLNRWMPAKTAMVIDTRKIHVVPLQGRSFFTKRVADTGDSQKGMVLGEYTLEVHNEEGMVKINNG
jgi:hypothetical protein